MHESNDDICLLLSILKMTQKRLLGFTKKELIDSGYCHVTASQDYVYAEGNIPVLVIAYLDTVHERLPQTIIHNHSLNELQSPEGLGADDRAGVFAILKIVKEGLKPYVLFATDEEIGCIGDKRFLQEIKCPDVNYIIELDRRGSEDAVFYGCTNQSFINYVLGYGFELAHGTSSDIKYLCSEWDLAGVNLSIGY